MMESIIKDDLMLHLKRNNLINPSQHGFMKNRSCTTNLLEFLEEVTAKADSGKSIDIIYLDFVKAFDKVPTQRLLKKLKAHGVEGRVAGWIEPWLTDRKQRVNVRGKTSGWQRVWSGVPQGSVLGPVLFLLFINDLDSAVTVTVRQTIKKFADDTKIMQVIETGDELQHSLDNLCEWARTWGMAFNEAKCYVMHVGRHNPRHVYHMNGIRLEMSDKERDIGVTTSQPSNVKRRPRQLQQCWPKSHGPSTMARVSQPVPAVRETPSRICCGCLVTMDPGRHPVSGVGPAEGRQGHHGPQGHHLRGQAERTGDAQPAGGERRSTWCKPTRS